MGYRRTIIQLFFRNMNDFFQVRREILPIVTKNIAKLDVIDAYAEVVGNETQMDLDFGDGDSGATYAPKAARASGHNQNATEFIIDIREYDVPYYLRVAIDKSKTDLSRC